MTVVEFPTHVRDYPIGSVRSSERLRELLCYEPETHELEWIRIAWHNDLAVAAYHVKPMTDQEYLLCALVVRENYRRRGIGRWMLAHALGVIESKGGRSVLVNSTRTLALFEKLGFERVSEKQLRLTLYPE